MNIGEKIGLIEKKLAQRLKEIERLPQGRLFVIHEGKHTKWWYSDAAHKRKYIPKKDRAFAEDLAIRKYLTLDVEILGMELEHLKRERIWSDDMRKICDRRDSLLNMDSGFRDLLMPYFRSFEDKINQWENESYPRAEMFSENCIFLTEKGDMVRSKSELMIANELFKAHIPYRYESRLDLETGSVYPDFTIYLPKENRLIYWEHFGMMDDEQYALKVCSKIKAYVISGLIPSINLFATFETANSPLTVERIRETINQFWKTA